MKTGLNEKQLKCDCCGKEFEVYYIAGWKWKLDDIYYCSYSCYSKEFDKKYTASKVNMKVLSAGGTPAPTKYIKEDE